MGLMNVNRKEFRVLKVMTERLSNMHTRSRKSSHTDGY